MYMEIEEFKKSICLSNEIEYLRMQCERNVCSANNEVACGSAIIRCDYNGSITSHGGVSYSPSTGEIELHRNDTECYWSLVLTFPFVQDHRHSHIVPSKGSIIEFTLRKSNETFYAKVVDVINDMTSIHIWDPVLRQFTDVSAYSTGADVLYIKEVIIPIAGCTLKSEEELYDSYNEVKG